MKHKKNLNPFLQISIFVSALLLVAVVITIALFYYIFGITEPEGLSLASWPDTFTDNFSTWMENDNGSIHIKEIGLERLDEYGLWLQVIDETGQEIFCYNKPEHYPTSYSASELISLRTSAYEHGNTVFVNSYENNGKTWNYLIGFPYAIGKYMLYYNGGAFGRLFPVFRMGLTILMCVIVLLVICYVCWLTRHLGKITNGIEAVSLRSYTPLPEKGIFREIYTALNRMGKDVLHSDKVQENTERVRREWIVNITHDLKTPLSPIKGYAELLTDSPVPSKETIQEYGKIILKNVNYTENMINDLKMTYQLDSGTMPYHPQTVHLVRFLRELVIDIANDPAFARRDITLESNIQELETSLEPDLFRRAVTNLIVNALTHNPPETKVIVRIEMQPPNKLCIYIIDNGIGMNAEEQSELFNRYYRGTNTKEKPEGSGLGLAIAKQIVALHGGDISVTSKQGEGTQFLISLPID